MKNLYTIATIIIFGVFIFINILTLKDGHNWGDDFAQYIQHAVNLVEHKPYASGISYDLWVIYPPGFPFLLSSVIYWFGVNFKVLKSLNVLLWALSALAVYGLAISSLDILWARLITVWFLTSPFFFFFKQNILSDIPFMCFVLFSLWAFMKFDEEKQKGMPHSSGIYLWVSIFCMSYSLLIRWAGVSLFLSVILYFSVVKKDWKQSLVFILGTLIAWFISYQCGSSAMGYFDNNTVAHLQKWPSIGWFNLIYNFQTILSFFISNDMLCNLSGPLFSCISGLVFLVIMGVFFYRICVRKAGFMECFSFVYMIGATLWPIHEGMRFLLPVVVPISIYLFKFISKVWKKLAVIIALLLILQNVSIIASDFNFNNDDVFQKDSIGMMQWVQTNIKPGVNYMFSHSRALGLLTHRIGHSFWVYQEDMKEWYKRIKPLHINYLIADKRFDEFSRYDDLRFRVDNYEVYIKVVWQNNIYKIFKVDLPANSGPKPLS